MIIVLEGPRGYPQNTMHTGARSRNCISRDLLHLYGVRRVPGRGDTLQFVILDETINFKIANCMHGRDVDRIIVDTDECTVTPQVNWDGV